MTAPLRLVLILHNHQPVGNFDHVFEQAFQDSYRPFLDVFEPYEDLRIALHTSGPLLEWLNDHHGEYVERLAALVAAGRIEIVGGPFYEPILTMIPPCDRRGQITRYSQWLANTLHTEIRGMWMPERVWEQALVTDIAAAGISYTLLDDFHFKKAGLVEDELFGYFVTEENGALLNVFPGSERLRYTIPFADPQATIDYLGEIQARQPGAIVAFGDDGEKFGVWPDTKKHVYGDGWLRRFFDALVKNRSWIDVATPSEAMSQVPPLGKLYIPEGSYREMTEWALPAKRIEVFEELHHELDDSGLWERIAPFMRVGYWRNFKVKYPETNEMYARMQMVSRRLQKAISSGARGELIDWAQRELYRGQCNCAYWHGAFGGAYLPHLRQAVYNKLIAAENLLDQAEGRGLGELDDAWAELSADDYNFDARQEVRLASNRVVALFAPAAGGQMYELDVRPICMNALATLARRPEAYHRKVLAGPSSGDGDVASIHDRVVFKQKDLHERIQYDAHLRKSLLDHFLAADATADGLASGAACELGDFVDGVYEARLRRGDERMQLVLSRDGRVGDFPLRVTKKITLEAGGSQLDIEYVLEGLPPEVSLHFAVEFNFAGMPGHAIGRFFRGEAGDVHGGLHERLNLAESRELALVDEWLGLEVGIHADRPTGFWTFPIETVSQSEGGFELVHQSVVVVPHWHVLADDQGRWQVKLQLGLDTSAAEVRAQASEAAGDVLDDAPVLAQTGAH
jgi:alpha-amylase